MSLLHVLPRLGYLASRSQLAALGIGRHLIDQSLGTGALLPVRPGWVATRDASQLAILAVLRGGRLTAHAALRSYGIWAGHDRRTHVQVAPNSHRVFQQPTTPLVAFVPAKHALQGFAIHWANAQEVPASSPAWRVSVIDALVRFARVESAEQILAAIESAVHEKRMPQASVAAVFRQLPQRLQRLAERLNYLAESGLESICRFRLEDLGYHITQQVQIGPDRVDIVIDGWLIIEMDGDLYHDPDEDRKRTNRLIRAGYVVLRFGHDQLFDGWNDMLATIIAAHEQRTGRVGA